MVSVIIKRSKASFFTYAVLSFNHTMSVFAGMVVMKRRNKRDY